MQGNSFHANRICKQHFHAWFISSKLKQNSTCIFCNKIDQTPYTHGLRNKTPCTPTVSLSQPCISSNLDTLISTHSWLAKASPYSRFKHATTIQDYHARLPCKLTMQDYHASLPCKTKNHTNTMQTHGKA